jgi:hypothetical protein
VLAASTLRTYENTWSPQFTDIGFLNRLFIVPGTGKRRFSFPPRISEINLQPLRNGLTAILDFIGDSKRIGISEDGREFFQTWYEALPQSVHAKRLDGIAIRLMMLLSANELKEEIDLDTAQKACALADWQFKVRQLHDPISADSKIAAIEEKIRRLLRTRPHRETELKRGVHYTRVGIFAWKTAIGNLITSKEVVIDHLGRYALNERK